MERSQYGENSEALYLTSGYVQTSAAYSGRALCHGEEEGFTYCPRRQPHSQPAWRCVWRRLEGTEAAIATSSGMSAILLLGMGAAESGRPCHLLAVGVRLDHSSCSAGEFAKFGVQTTFVSQTDVAHWKAAVRPNTKLLFAETPTNPLTEVCDIQRLGRYRPRRRRACWRWTTAFATPALQRPARLGG